MVSPVEIELRKLSDIKPYPGNPRQNDAAVDAVAASIQQLGFRQPVVVDTEGLIVCGHTRRGPAWALAPGTSQTGGLQHSTLLTQNRIQIPHIFWRLLYRGGESLPWANEAFLPSR